MTGDDLPGAVAVDRPNEVDGAPATEAPPPADAKAVLAQFQAYLREVTPRVRVVPAIIALNFVVFGVMVATGVHPFAPAVASVKTWGANYGPLTLGGQPWRLLSNVFLHFGAVHLLLNMLALWNAGALVERIFDPLAFAALYLVAGLTGSLASVGVHPQVVSAGASGAVFGVYGALAAFLARQRGAIPTPVLSKLQGVALSFIGYNIVFGFVTPQIDNAAHIGGLLGGAAAGAFLARPLRPSRRSEGLRPAAIVAATSLLAVAIVLLLPRPFPLDFGGTFGEFSAVEKPVLAAYNQLVDETKSGLRDADFAARLEREVLSPWRAARQRLAAPRPWRPAEQEGIDLLLRYVEARERAWTTLAAALRTHDPEGAQRANEQEAEATRVIEELNHWKPH